MYKIEEILDAYLRRGFGSMNKNDFEVWIFNQLLHERLSGMSNYEISRELNMPETKVKRLRYEADLKYSSDDEIKKRLPNLLNECLEKAYIKNVGKDVQIQFIVEDLSVRKYLDYILKKGGYFSDSSFNSEIVSVRSEGLKHLYQSTPEGMKKIDTLKKADSEKNGKESQGWFTTFLQSIAKGAGEAVGFTSVNLSMKSLFGYMGIG